MAAVPFVPNLCAGRFQLAAGAVPLKGNQEIMAASESNLRLVKAKAPRPILIDPADGPCDICPPDNRVCYDCGAGGELSVGPGAAPGEHFHITQVNGVPGREHVAMNRCGVCHSKLLQEA